MRSVGSFVVGLSVALLWAPLAVWWTMSVHEPYCSFGEAFWDGDLPVGPGPVQGLFLGSSRAGADVDLEALAESTGAAWQRLARHTLSENALVPSYPELLTASDARPGLRTLLVEVSPLLVDEVSCSRPAIPHVPLMPWWFSEAGSLGMSERPSALAMALLPHRWLAGSGRRHDLVEHVKAPGHLLRAVADLRRGTRGRIARWPGEPAPALTAENARNRREFLLGAKLSTWRPAVNASCIETIERVVDAAAAERTVLLMLPMRPMLRETVEPEYWSAATAAFAALAAAAPGRELVDYTRLYDDGESMFNDFDHLTEAGARDFTRVVAARLEAR